MDRAIARWWSLARMHGMDVADATTHRVGLQGDAFEPVPHADSLGWLLGQRVRPVVDGMVVVVVAQLPTL